MIKVKCAKCDYKWNTKYNKPPKRCPKCKAKAVVPDMETDDDLPHGLIDWVQVFPIRPGQ